jgi:toxin ParE1/3/4
MKLPRQLSRGEQNDQTAQTNPVAAAAFVADLTGKIERISQIGLSGTARDWIRPGLRALPYRDRCFYFRIDDNALYLLRVLHGKQDVEKQEFTD